MNKLKITIILTFISLCIPITTVQAIGIGPPGFPDNPYPDYTPDYTFCESEHLNNTTPPCFTPNIPVTPKGVQTCIDIIIDQGCTANLTIYYYNWTYVIETYGTEIAYVYEIPTAWTPFYYVEDIDLSTTICTYDENATCATENWWTEYRLILFTAYFNCSGDITNESVFLFYTPEQCPIFTIIHPPFYTPICPCCETMCITINNTDGNPMNLSFYRARQITNTTPAEDLTYRLVYQYENVTNGSYCFCIDGYYDPLLDLYISMSYDETYFWYVNMTDLVTDVTTMSDYYFFTTCETADDCPCGGDELVEYIEDHGGRGEMLNTPDLSVGVIFAALICIFLNRKKIRMI